MRIQYKVHFNLQEEERDWVIEIPEKISNTVIESPEAPATGDIVYLHDFLYKVDLSVDQMEEAIEYHPYLRVISVVHANDLVIVNLEQDISVNSI